jgi:hypothetical protein
MINGGKIVVVWIYVSLSLFFGSRYCLKTMLKDRKQYGNMYTYRKNNH